MGYWELLLVPLAIAYSHMAEWVLHKYVLHGLGKKKSSKFSFHWHGHHRKARKNKFYDYDYKHPFKGPAARELRSLGIVLLIHLPLTFVLPIVYGTLVLCTIRYFYLHRKMHLNPAFARINYPIHWDHHMGKNQNKNWAVTVEWPDRLLGTRQEPPKVTLQRTLRKNHPRLW